MKFLVIILINFFIFLFGGLKYTNDLVKFGLKGKVRSLLESYHTKIINTSGVQKGYSSNKWVHKFNKKGNLIEEDEYRSNGDSADSRRLFKYNNYDTLIEINEYNKVEGTKQRTTFTYDASRNRIATYSTDLSDSTNSSGGTFFTYDGEGNLDGGRILII